MIQPHLLNRDSSGFHLKNSLPEGAPVQVRIEVVKAQEERKEGLKTHLE
jgi:hypothetical protein